MPLGIFSMQVLTSVMVFIDQTEAVQCPMVGAQALESHRLNSNPGSATH